MRYLIINRTPLSVFRFPDWLGPDNQAVLLTDAGAVSSDPEVRAHQLAGYAHVEVVEDWHFNPAVELSAIRLHAEVPFDRVIAVSEFELLRAARVREVLGLPGQDVASAVAFRDKFAMKEILAGAGVPVAPYAAVSSVADLLAFVEKHGLPVVVKPRRGGGSMGVEVLRERSDIDDLLTVYRELGHDDGAHLIAEVFIEHELVHVDGLRVGEQYPLMWASTQSDTSCLDMRAGGSLRSAMLDPGDPLLAEANELTRRALAALPTPETSMFHAEIFRRPDGGLVFNEVACRAGGGMIEDMVQIGFGPFLPELYVRTLAGHEVPAVPAEPNQMGGLALFPPRPGRLEQIPEGQCPVPRVTAFQTYATVGDDLAFSPSSVGKIGSVLVAGSTRSEVESALTAATKWFDANTRVLSDSENAR